MREWHANFLSIVDVELYLVLNASWVYKLVKTQDVPLAKMS